MPPFKSGTNTLKDLIEWRGFCEKITLLSPTVRTDKESAKKNNKIFAERTRYTLYNTR